MRRYSILFALTFAIASLFDLSRQYAITEKDIEELELIEARRNKKLDFCTPILFACSGLLIGIFVGDIALIIYTHL